MVYGLFICTRQVLWTSDDISIAFVDKMLERFDVRTDRNIQASPIVKLDEFDPDESGSNGRFREAVGSLMWVAHQTRPDIANAVRAVARYCHAPKHKHWIAVGSILEYLRGTNK